MRALMFATSLALAGLIHTGPARAAGCAEQAEDMKVHVTDDLRTKRVAEEVGKKLLADLDNAIGLCKSGKSAQGEQIILKISKTFGYRLNKES